MPRVGIVKQTTLRRLRLWVERLRNSDDVRLTRVLMARDSIRRGMCDSDRAIDRVVEKLLPALQGGTQ